MPKLLSYIDLQNSALPKNTSRATLDKISQFTNSLRDYCHGEDIDMRLAQTTPFVIGYGTALTDGTVRNYSPTVANECVERLRSTLRRAMRMRLIPNYDPIPEALIRLREEVWHLDMKAETPIPIELNTQEETCELARRLTWLFANRGITRQPDDPAAQRRLRESITEARAALIVLFGLFFYGLDVESIIRLKTSEPSEIFVPKYGRSLPVPAVALSLARMHNEGKICTAGNHLFSVVSDTDTDEQIAAKAQRITARARKWLLREGFGLGNHSTLLGEWLTVAAATGAPADDIESALTYAAEDRLSQLPTETLLRLNNPDKSISGFLEQNWYVLCSYSTTFRGDRLRRHIAASGIFGTETDAMRRLYDPTDLDDDRRHESSAVSRFIFFRGNPMEAMLVDSLRRDASVLRVSRTRRFAIVPQHELELFQVALRDFRDDVDLVDREEWILAHRKEFAKSQKVIIHTGPFKGREATIVDIKTKPGKASGSTATTEPVYLLSFAHTTFTIVATATALALDAAPTPPSPQRIIFTRRNKRIKRN